MEPSRNDARYAGLLYWLAGLSAPFAYLYVYGILLVKNDALATVERVRASEGLLRVAIVAELYGATMLIFATLALYGLFKTVDRKIATLMVVMMLVSVPISYVNALNNIVPLVLLNTPAIATVLGPGDTAAQVTLFLQLHNYGLVVGQIFWGLWLFPIGILVLRSGFIPRWLAYAVFLAGAGYVSNSLGTLLLPPPLRWITENLQILGLGELLFFGLYLQIWGVRGYRVDRIAALLVLVSIAIGLGGLVLLNLHRIEASVYGAFVLASVVVLLGAVIRWRSDQDRPTTQTGAGT
jgi:hypothetical protein